MALDGNQEQPDALNPATDTPAAPDESVRTGSSAASVDPIDVPDLADFVDAIADTIEKRDPVVDALRGMLEDRISSDQVNLPRHPDVAARILDLAKNHDASMKDIIRQVRTDPVLAGRLLEMSNSAAFAGSQRVYSLKMAIVRLGLTKVGDVAFEMSGGSKNFQKDKRSNMLSRLWKLSLAAGFMCEELAKRVPGEQPESGFLTGLFHNVSGPLIVECVGRLEREGEIPPQGDSRILGLLEELGTEYTMKLVQGWNIPKPSAEAIRLQNAKVRERRGKPLAHLLVCSKALAAEMGMGTRPTPVVFDEIRDFHFLKLDDDQKLEAAREAVVDKMIQVIRA